MSIYRRFEIPFAKVQAQIGFTASKRKLFAVQAVRNPMIASTSSSHFEWAFTSFLCYRFSSERDSALGNYATQSCMQVVTFTIYCVFSRTHDFGCSTLHWLHDTAGAAAIHERRTACTTHDLQVFASVLTNFHSIVCLFSTMHFSPESFSLRRKSFVFPFIPAKHEEKILVELL